MMLTIAQLARHIGAELAGNAAEFENQIAGVGPISAAARDQVTFLTDPKHASKLNDSLAAAVIVSRAVEGCPKPMLIVRQVNAALIETLRLFAPQLKPAPEGVDPTATVAQGVKLGKAVSIGPGAVLEEGVQIGDKTTIASGCRIGQNSRLGSNCRIDSNVVIYHGCLLGDNVVIQANTTIGSTGFGYAFIDGAHRLIPHNGGVVIEDCVEIGANCCIDRAKFGNTTIGAGTKIDNLVQVAHNVVIGKCCLIAALVGVSGSCRLGDGVVLGGQVGLADNIEIGSGTMVAAQSGVMTDIAPGLQLAWTPAIEKTEAARIIALTMRLPKMARQLKDVSKRLEKLEAAENDKG